jgi:Tol biopolymer transport system component
LLALPALAVAATPAGAQTLTVDHSILALAVASPRTGSQIVVVDFGSGSRKVVVGGHGELYAGPAWSPDGASLAYSAARPHATSPLAPPGPSAIYLVEASGSGRGSLTGGGYADGEPSWAPDGRRVAFSRARTDRLGRRSSAIWTVATSGRHLRRVTSPRGYASQPAWSPDGRWIAYTRSAVVDGAVRTEIDVVRPDGSGGHWLVADGSAPAWSPDGERIAYRGAGDGSGACPAPCPSGGEIYVADADGSNATRISDTESDESAISFGPDGRTILFLSDRESPAAHLASLFAANLDGSCPTLLLPGARDLSIGSAAWRPGTLDPGPLQCADESG